MMLKRNGYVLEQLFSPLVVRTSPLHRELVSLGERCITRHHVHHYRGFAHTQWELFHKERPRRVKPLLYVYRVLLTGIHLMRSGVVEANLPRLNEEAKLPYIPELIARKTGSQEQARLEDADLELHEREFQRLLGELEGAFATSCLREETAVRPELDALIVKARLQMIGG